MLVGAVRGRALAAPVPVGSYAPLMTADDHASQPEHVEPEPGETTTPAIDPRLLDLAEMMNETLHPDLEPYLEQMPVFGQCLRHPLVYQVPFHNPGLANKAYAYKRESLDRAKQRGAIHTYVFSHERPWRLSALRDVWEEWDMAEVAEHATAARHADPGADSAADLTKDDPNTVTVQSLEQELHETLSSVWVDSENIWQNQGFWETVLVEDGRMWMDEDDQAIYDALPDEVTVHRGCIEGQNEDGMSWTTDLNTARWFAQRFTDKGRTPIVVTGTVDKRDIVACFSARSEHEVVVHYDNVHNKRIESPAKPHQPRYGVGADTTDDSDDFED